MKKLYCYLVFAFLYNTLAKAQQDCCLAQALTGSSAVTIPSNSGNGTPETLSACSCLATNEHHAYWFSFVCQQGGTFEMMITPANLGADFDFALYAVECPCAPGTVVVSCDYTGPITPPGPFVPTGISSTPMTTFGVPGATEFRPTVTLTTGTRYYIVADNITSNGNGFTIQFAGSAVIGPPPPNNSLPAPTPLNGSITACPGATLPYNVPNTPGITSYDWTVTPPTAGISGNGSSSVNVTWPAVGSYQLCVTTKAGCESSPPACKTVNVQPIVTTPVSDVICVGSAYTAPSGQVFFAPGSYLMNFTSFQGCDSIVPLTLTPALFSNTILFQEICAGECFPFNGQQLCQTGVYQNTLTNYLGCDSIVQLILDVLPNDAIITGNGPISCNGTPVVLSGSSSTGGANLTYQWTNQSGQVVGTGVNLPVTTPGNYTLTISSQAGTNTCTDSQTITVSANNTPPANVTATGGLINCSVASVSLAGNSTSPGVSYSWTGPGGFTSNQQNPSVTVTGTYVLTVTGGNGCTATASAQVTGNSSLPDVSALGGTISCSSTSVTLTGNSSTPGVTYQWTGPGGFTSAQQNPGVSAAGNYTLTVTAPNGCSQQTTAQVIQDVTPPGATATGGSVNCLNTSLLLNGSSAAPNVSYSWAGPGGFTSGMQNPSVTVPGTYTLTVTATNGCTSTAAATVTQDANAPTATASGGTLNCQVLQLNLNGNTSAQNATFSWTGPNGFTSNVEDPAVSVPGTYILTVTASNGCYATASAQVGQDNALPNVSATGGTLTCTTGNVGLQGNSSTPGVSYAWAGPGGFTSSQQNPTVSQAGLYTLTVTAGNGCSATATAPVQIDAGVPDVFAEGDTLNCSIASVVLQGGSNTAGVTYAWAGPGGFTSTQVNPAVTVAGTYILTVTAPNNCTAQANALVVLDNQLPNVAASGGMLTCIETSVTLNGSSTSSGAAFSWNGPGGFTSSSAAPVVSTPGTYTLTVTGLNGCTTTATALVDENKTLPDIQVAGGVIDCNSPSFLLQGISATPGSSFNWSGPGGFAANQQDTAVVVAGVYTLQVTASNGCTSTASAIVDENTTAPDVSAVGGLLDCGTSSISLAGSSGTPGVTWAWTGPGGFTAFVQNPPVGQAGNYTLMVTAPNGCTSTATAIVDQDAGVPNVDVQGGLLTCAETTVQLTGSSTSTGVSFGWTGPGGFSSSEQSPIVSLPGSYMLTVTAANGCSASAAALVSQDIAPPAATASGGLLTCLSGVLTLSGGSTTPGATFSWAGPAGFTANIPNPQVTTPGTYVLSVTGPNGCTQTATAQAIADSNTPTVSAAGGELTCTVTQLVLNGSSTTPNVTFSWMGPGGFTSNAPNPTISQPGTYTLTVTASNGCTNATDAVVTANTTQPDVSAGGGQITCQAPAIPISGGSSTPGVTYQWTGPGGFISQIANPTVSASGTYTLVVTAANGCTNSATAQVTVDNDVPVISATGGTLTCSTTQIQLIGTSSQQNVAWQWTGPGGFLSGEQSPVASVPGSYTLQVTNSSGCVVSANAVLAQNNQAPAIAIGIPDQLDCITETVTLNAAGSDQGAGFTLQWTTANGNILADPNSLTPLVDAPGVYTLSIVNQVNGCSSSQNVEVFISDAAPSGAVLQTNNPVCFGEKNGSVVVDSVTGGIPPYVYALGNQTFGTGSTFQNLAPGIYTLTIQDATGCEWSTSVTLSEPAQVSVSLDAVNLVENLVNLGDSVELKANVPISLDLIQSVAWLPEGLANGCGFCLTQVVSPFETTTYTVIVKDINGCSASDELTLFVDRRKPVFIPNAFSPNGDGINDLLTVFGGQSVANVKRFLVLSRWGETVFQYFDFQPNDPAFGWDGRHRGKELNPDVFTWFAEIEFIDGKSAIFEGDVMLIK